MLQFVNDYIGQFILDSAICVNIITTKMTIRHPTKNGARMFETS